MPTVLRLDGLRVVIYPNDHSPAHVHVKGAGGEAVYFLNCPEGPPELRESFGFSLSDVRRIARSLEIDTWSSLNESSPGPKRV